MSSESEASNHHSDSENTLDATVVPQREVRGKTAALIENLMERLKVLESNIEHTTSQLLDSEKKRSQLQERLQVAESKNVANQADVPTTHPPPNESASCGEYSISLISSIATSVVENNATTSVTAAHGSQPTVFQPFSQAPPPSMFLPKSGGYNSMSVVSQKESSTSLPKSLSQPGYTQSSNVMIGAPSTNLMSTSACQQDTSSGGQVTRTGTALPSMFQPTSVCPTVYGTGGTQPPYGVFALPSYTSLPTSACQQSHSIGGSQSLNAGTVLPSMFQPTSVCPPIYGASSTQSPHGYFASPLHTTPPTLSCQKSHGQSQYATFTAPTSIFQSTSVCPPFNGAVAGQPPQSAFGTSQSFFPQAASNSAYHNTATPAYFGSTRKLHDLPEFHGYPEQWPVFITTFNESSAVYGYSALENLFRLQKSLKGIAKEEVEGLLINPQNVPRIIEQLEFKFGQPELLIKTQLQKVYEITAIDENHLERLVPFATKVQNLTIFLCNANATQHMNNPMLLEELVAKMPMTKRIEWATVAAHLKPYATLEHFCQWIMQMSRIISKATMCASPIVSTGRPHISSNKIQARQGNKQVLYATEVATPQPNNEPVCLKCKGKHYLTQCNDFLELKVDDKWKLVKEKRLCFCCLRQGHNIYGCKRKVTCKAQGCKKLHHTALHQNEAQQKPAVQPVNTIYHKSTNLLFKVLPVKLLGPNNKIIESYAFLDEGSSATLISEKLAKDLGINEKEESLTLQWFGNRVTNVKTMKCKLRISGVGKDKKWFDLDGNSVPNLKLPLQSVNLQELQDKFKQLQGLPVEEYCDAKPDILIGINNCHLTASMKSVVCDNDVVASRTSLGWVIYGMLQKSKGNSSCRVSIILHTKVKEDPSIEQEIHDMVKDYFTTENFGVAKSEKPLESSDVIRARSLLQSTSKRLINRFEIGLLWSSDDVKLPESYSMALSRLKNIELKMGRDHMYRQQYENAVMNLVKNGYAVKMTPQESAEKGPRTWYLPHFAVFNINKPNKLRMVFDAAATVEGISLNSVLLKGPDENPPLIKVLFKFREGKVAVCADIKEMFLQVMMKREDQDSLRFLWRSHDSQEVGTYRMVSMIFGASCSPCCAQYIKNLNAEQVAADQPKVVKAIKDSHYVDNYVCSFRTQEEALGISQRVKEVHMQAGFELRGFVSNSSFVQEQLNGAADNDLSNTYVKLASDAMEKILGIHWDSSADEFYFKLQMNRVAPEVVSGSRAPSKRELLSLVMSVYDPFGMLADYTIYGKLLIQDVWRVGINWNEAVPANINNKFKQWINQLDNVKKFRLHRCYSPQLLNPDFSIELHVLVDASESAFAAVAYWRIVFEHNIEVSFIAGKTKCAPLKMLSIPRLELQAAVLGNRLRNSIVESHNVQVNRTVYWSDSTTVLFWIKSDKRLFKPFVAHRVSEILETSTANDWKWVPTKLNIADVATRPKYPLLYETPSKWTQGPEFLKLTEDKWPVQPGDMQNAASMAEQRKICLAVLHDPIVDLSRFSNFLRLQRTIAWVLRAVNKFRDAKGSSCAEKQNGELSANELFNAELFLCRMVQNQVYEKELFNLQSKKSISRSSDIFSLNPALNEDEVLVVGGRLDYAIALPKLTRRPMILPKRHVLTDLIVMWYHKRYHHQNEELTVNEIRRKYWIPHLRREVNRARSNCQECKNNNAKPKPPLMGQLPLDRVTPYVRPFTYSGIDYFGPVFVTIGRRHEKRWVALFTCLTTRAIHVELAADLSTDACILCIRNFVNRRGVPIKIRSDMGTNFVGTDGEFKKVADLFDYDRLQTELTTKGILWQFNCPANPSSGGCWERLIKSVKRVLAVTLKQQAPQVETLRSLLIEAENIVNSRPLTHLPVYAEDPEPLTPNHFLLGTTNSTQTPGEESSVCTRKQYRISQQLKNTFWHRWIREYLPTLTRRTKWFEPVRQVKKGDVVLICDENQARSKWRRGVVVKPIQAKDGQTRIAEVRTSDGVLSRPVSKLAILDVIGKAP